MSFISLESFQKSAALSDASLVVLLKKGLLKLRVTDGKKIEIDVSSVEMKDLVQAIATKREQLLSDQVQTLSQGFGRMVAAEVEACITEALARVQAGEVE